MRPRTVVWVIAFAGIMTLSACAANRDGLELLPGTDGGTGGMGGGGNTGGTGAGGTGAGGTGGSTGTGGMPGLDGGSTPIDTRPADLALDPVPGKDLPSPSDTNGMESAPPQTGWTALEARLPGGPRQEVGVAELGGLVFVVGGLSNRFNEMAPTLVEAFDPATGKWETHASMPAGLDHPNVAAVGGKLYVLGGFSDGAPLGITMAYDPETRMWETKEPMPAGTERAAAAIAAIGTKIYVAGGHAGFGSGSQSLFQSFDTEKNEWESLPNLPGSSRNHLVGAAVNGVFYAIGGRTGTSARIGLQNRVDAYIPEMGQWRRRADMLTARAGCAAGVLGNFIAVVGGEGNALDVNPDRVFPEFEVFETSANGWLTLTDMLTPRHGTGGAVVDGKLYVPAGGAAQGASAPTDIIEVYSP